MNGRETRKEETKVTGSKSPKNVVMLIAGRIKKARLDMQISQRALADMTGLERPNISRLESGAHAPTLSTLIRVSDALKIKVSDLLTGI